jgi:DNA-directed RNA polymerase subunit RPC12/RpoP
MTPLDATTAQIVAKQPSLLHAPAQEGRKIPEHMKRFDKYFLDRTRGYVREVEESERRRTMLSALMFKRFRGDFFGFFLPFNGPLRYTDVPSDGLMKYPLFEPVVRANNRGWLETDIRPEIDPVDPTDPEAEGGAKIARSVVESLHDADGGWNDTSEELMAEYAQLAFAYGLYTRHEEEGGEYTRKVARMRPASASGETMEYACAACGATGDPAELESAEDPRCPFCAARGQDSPVSIEVAEGDPYAGEAHEGWDEVDAGREVTDVVPSFLFRVDEMHVKGGEIQKGHWVNYHPVTRRYEIEAETPWIAEQMSKVAPGKDWAESTQWWHALQTSCAAPAYGTAVERRAGTPSDDLFERNFWWLTPEACSDFVEPDGYDHDAENPGCECGFRIERGQTVEEAHEAWKPGEEFKGLFLSLVGDVYQTIDTCRSHREEWAMGLWLMDASSAWGKGQESLLDFQHAVNEWFTMFFEHGIHNALPHTIVDGMMFDGLPLRNQPGKVSVTRKGLVREKSIGDYIHQLPPGQMGADQFSIFSGYMEGMRWTSGIQQATVGAPDPYDRTSSGQMMKRNQSMSLLTPSQKSKGRAKSAWVRQRLRFAQKWPDEAFVRLAGKAGGEWKMADVAAFRALDVDRDLKVSIKDGTDVPMDRAEREYKLIALYQSGLLADPNVPVEIKQIAINYAGLDLSLNDSDATVRSASSRLRKMQALSQFAAEQGLQFVTDPATGQIVVEPEFVMQPDTVQDPATGAPAPNPLAGQPMTDEQGQPVANPYAGQPMVNQQTIAKIMTRPGVALLERQDDHAGHAKFLNAHIIALWAMDEPDLFLVRLLQKVVDSHLLQLAQNMADEAAAQPQAPGEGGGGEDPEAAREGEREKADRQEEGKQKERDFKAGESQKQRKHDLMKQRMQSDHQRTQALITAEKSRIGKQSQVRT